VLLIFWLIAYSLAANTFPDWHPDWSVSLNWSLALVTAVLFFVSLLAHEFAHSLVAKWKGLKIDRITLFLFGGMAELKTQPETAGVEFMVAIAGPLMSVVIGLGSIALASTMLGPEFVQRLTDDMPGTMSSLAPLPTLLLWLGPINVVLAVFNMVPGFPLDGGRVLRSIIWAITGDMGKATRWATGVGRVVALGFMGWGAIQMFGGAYINGLWMIFIGWFLFSAARAAYTESVLRTSLQGHNLSELMETIFEFADATEDIETFTREKALHRSQSVWPVMKDGSLVGILTVDALAKVPPEARSLTLLGQIAHPIQANDFVAPELPGNEVLKRLKDSDYGVVLVVKDDRIVGLLRHADVIRWLTLHTST
jgi:Zn-dependent protease